MTTALPVVAELDRVDTGRICGHCQLCCKLLPIYDLLDAQGNPKPWNRRCIHQRKGNHGCTVYHTGRPPSCKSWSCAWLVSAGTEDLPRPDKGHYVVDTYITSFELLGLGFYQSLQVWLEPEWPHAWRCTKLIPYMARMAEQHGYATTVRLRDKDDSLLIFPPALAPVRGRWAIADTRKGLANITLDVLDFKSDRLSTQV